MKDQKKREDNKHKLVVFFFVFEFLPVSRLFVSPIEATRKRKQKGKEINGEDLQQRHNVNTQRYAVLASCERKREREKERRDYWSLQSLSLSLCSPHFSSPSFKSLRIRMRFAVLSFSSIFLFPEMAGHLNLSSCFFSIFSFLFYFWFCLFFYFFNHSRKPESSCFFLCTR